jgi:lipopolysaccharide/colanic/teichoic acid biosynthesis glycosyltransferase
MLYEMPRRAPERQTGDETPQDTFEASLRRDISGDALISCSPVIGGWLKRGFDLLVLAVAAPVLGPLLLVRAVSYWRRKQPAFVRCETVGYGGRRFQRLLWAGDPGEPANDIAQASLSERLPQLLNVLRGEMSLVGPLPLAQDQVCALKTSVRHYLSARPGVFGVRAIVDAPQEDPAHYKAYALSWSLLADSVLLWQELSALRRLRSS